ncbi:hypothetical protein BH09MYX1_BH09MYX1_66360 [soil metagenome]
MVGPGDTLGRYRIESALGAGGMGEVFRAWDSTLRRWVALKVVARMHTARAERLLAEARAVATLKHPNVVSVFDVGETDDVAFVSMDLIVGKTLREHVGDATIPMDTRKAWLLQIASALSAAHRGGLVHRDVKPENVMVGEDGQAHVLDFGIAKAFGIDVVGPTQHGDEAAAPQFLTGEGRIIGTPAYMAPEQLAGGPPAPAWDQYAWGILAYELLTGKHPRLAGLISSNGWVKPADEVAPVPPELAEVASHATAPSPEQRYPSMDDVVLALGGSITTSGPARVQTLPPPAMASRPKAPLSTHAPRAKNAVIDTLPTAVHGPTGARPKALPSWLKFGALAIAFVALLGGAIAVGAKVAGTTASAPSATPISAPSAATIASWETASAAPTVAPSTASTASSAVPSSSVTSAPLPTVVIRPAPPKPLVVKLRSGASAQYDPTSIDRVVQPFRPLIAQCIEQNRPRTLPAVFGVLLELWTFADEVGKVRSVVIHEPAPLQACLTSVFQPLSFGTPRDPTMPPGAVFITVDITAP